MNPEMDPEEKELEAIRSLGETGGARTLEIGSGEGRLSARLLRLTSPVVGVDPSLKAILAGRTGGHPAAGRVVADARHLPFRSATFDQVAFGWSL